MENDISILSKEKIIAKIFLVRRMKVMLASDLAGFYEVQTKELNKAVARNLNRFPSDFMFQLTTQE